MNIDMFIIEVEINGEHEGYVERGKERGYTWDLVYSKQFATPLNAKEKDMFLNKAKKQRWSNMSRKKLERCDFIVVPNK